MVAQIKDLADLDQKIKPAQDLVELKLEIEEFLQRVKQGIATNRVITSNHILKTLEKGRTHEEEYIRSCYQNLHDAYYVRIEFIRDQSAAAQK